MTLTFYNNKLLRHPERLAGYLLDEDIMPLTLDIDLTNRCNSNCPGCVGQRQTKQETLETLAVVELLIEAEELGIEAVVFTGGGEPTMHPDFVYLLDKAKKIGLEVAVVTNGILLSVGPDIVNAIVENCTWIRVSVDAGDKEMYKKTHGFDGYAKVIEGFQYLNEERKKLKSPITIGAAYLTGKETIEGIESCCVDVESAGADYLYLRPFLKDTTHIDALRYAKCHNNGHFEVIWARAYDHLNDTKKSYSKCGFGWWVSVVQADGNVTWCCRTRCIPKYTLGNIYDDNLETILKRRKDIKVDFRDCTILCRGDEVNKFLHNAQIKVMHEAFL